jgi:hypothetical protein
LLPLLDADASSANGKPADVEAAVEAAVKA